MVMVKDTNKYAHQEWDSPHNEKKAISGKAWMSDINISQIMTFLESCFTYAYVPCLGSHTLRNGMTLNGIHIQNT